MNSSLELDYRFDRAFKLRDHYLSHDRHSAFHNDAASVSACPPALVPTATIAVTEPGTPLKHDDALRAALSPMVSSSSMEDERTTLALAVAGGLATVALDLPLRGFAVAEGGCTAPVVILHDNDGISGRCVQCMVTVPDAVATSDPVVLELHTRYDDPISCQSVLLPLRLEDTPDFVDPSPMDHRPTASLCSPAATDRASTATVAIRAGFRHPSVGAGSTVTTATSVPIVAATAIDVGSARMTTPRLPLALCAADSDDDDDDEDMINGWYGEERSAPVHSAASDSGSEPAKRCAASLSVGDLDDAGSDGSLFSDPAPISVVVHGPGTILTHVYFPQTLSAAPTPAGANSMDHSWVGSKTPQTYAWHDAPLRLQCVARHLDGRIAWTTGLSQPFLLADEDMLCIAAPRLPMPAEGLSCWEGVVQLPPTGIAAQRSYCQWVALDPATVTNVESVPEPLALLQGIVASFPSLSDEGVDVQSAAATISHLGHAFPVSRTLSPESALTRANTTAGLRRAGHHHHHQQRAAPVGHAPLPINYAPTSAGALLTPIIPHPDGTGSMLACTAEERAWSHHHDYYEPSTVTHATAVPLTAMYTEPGQPQFTLPMYPATSAYHYPVFFSSDAMSMPTSYPLPLVSYSSAQPFMVPVTAATCFPQQCTIAPTAHVSTSIPFVAYCAPAAYSGVDMDAGVQSVPPGDMVPPFLLSSPPFATALPCVQSQQHSLPPTGAPGSTGAPIFGIRKKSGRRPSGFE